MAANLCIDFLRKRKRQGSGQIISLDEEAPETGLTGLTLVRHGEEVFSYRLYDDEEMKQYPDFTVRLVMTYPFVNQLNDAMLNELLLSNLVNISAKEIIEDWPKDLAKYGLDADVDVLTWTLADTGEEKQLTLSQPTEDGIRYGMMRGMDSVLTVGADKFEFIEKFDYTRALYRTLWSYNIKDLAGFDVNAHGEVHEIRVYDPTKEESEAGAEFWATFDGEELREENARRLYIRVLSPGLYDLTDAEVDTSVEPDWSCVIHFDSDRADETIAFYRLNGRQYAAYRNGKPTGFYVNTVDLQEIDRALEIIKEGDLIPNN